MLWLSSYVIFHGIFFPACGSNDFLFILCFFFPCWLCALWPFYFFSACPFCVRFSLCTVSLGKYNYFLLDFAFAYGNLYALYSIRMSFSIFQLLLRSGGDHIVVCDRHRHRHRHHYCRHCTECLLFSPLGVCVLKWTMVCTRFCKICMQLNKIVRCIIKITEFTIQLLLILNYVNLHALLSCKIDCVCPVARSLSRALLWTTKFKQILLLLLLLSLSHIFIHSFVFIEISAWFLPFFQWPSTALSDIFRPTFDRNVPLTMIVCVSVLLLLVFLFRRFVCIIYFRCRWRSIFALVLATHKMQIKSTISFQHRIKSHMLTNGSLLFFSLFLCLLCLVARFIFLCCSHSILLKVTVVRF